MADGDDYIRFDSDDQQLHHAELAHAAIRGLPANLDSKATFFASLLTAVLFFQYKSFDPAILRLPQSLAAASPHFIAAYLYMGITLIALICSYVVVMPRTGGNTRLLFSYISFDSRKRAEDVLADFAGYDEARTKEAVLRHCYELSRLCANKTLWLRIAFFFGAAALGLFLIFQVAGVMGLEPQFTHFRLS